jgi:hypothetical protein
MRGRSTTPLRFTQFFAQKGNFTVESYFEQAARRTNASIGCPQKRHLSKSTPEK